MNMDNKTLSIVSYVTLIGWLISYFVGKENANSLLKYHLKQGLGVFIVGFCCNIVVGIISYIIPSIAMLLSSLVSILFLILIIIGILNANKEIEKPLPLIGQMFVNSFKFIK